MQIHDFFSSSGKKEKYKSFQYISKNPNQVARDTTTTNCRSKKIHQKNPLQITADPDVDRVKMNPDFAQDPIRMWIFSVEHIILTSMMMVWKNT